MEKKGKTPNQANGWFEKKVTAEELGKKKLGKGQETLRKSMGVALFPEGKRGNKFIKKPLGVEKEARDQRQSKESEAGAARYSLP